MGNQKSKAEGGIEIADFKERMAYSVWLTGISKMDRAELFCMEPSWRMVDKLRTLLTCN